MTPEGKHKKYVKDALDKNGAWFTMPHQSGYSNRGVPDFIGVLRGRMFAVECKADVNKKPTTLQERELRIIREAGGTTFVYPRDADMFNSFVMTTET